MFLLDRRLTLYMLPGSVGVPDTHFSPFNTFGIFAKPQTPLHRTQHEILRVSGLPKHFSRQPWQKNLHLNTVKSTDSQHPARTEEIDAEAQRWLKG